MDIPIGDRAAFNTPRFCSVDDCENKHAAIGFCMFHWHRNNDGRPLEPAKYALRAKPVGSKRTADDGYVYVRPDFEPGQSDPR